MKNADAFSKGIYGKKAKVIEEIRKGIIEVSSKEDMNNEVRTEYYNIIESNNFYEKITWNLKAISPKDNAEGYIVQHMKITSMVEEIQDSDYWEAWKVCSGIVENPKCVAYDDNWSLGFEYEGVEFTVQNGCGGCMVEYESEVYWIPKDSKIYPIICGWKVNLLSPANELKMTYEFNENMQPYFVCKRHRQFSE